MNTVTVQAVQDELLKANAQMFVSRVQGLWCVVIMRAPHTEVARASAVTLADALSLAFMSVNCDLESLVE